MERFDGPPPSGWTVGDDGTEGAPSEWRPVHGRRGYPRRPAPGEGFTYLVRGRSLLCAGTGTFGASSSGVERRPDPGASCP